MKGLVSTIDIRPHSTPPAGSPSDLAVTNGIARPHAV